MMRTRKMFTPKESIKNMVITNNPDDLATKITAFLASGYDLNIIHRNNGGYTCDYEGCDAYPDGLDKYDERLYHCSGCNGEYHFCDNTALNLILHNIVWSVTHPTTHVNQLPSGLYQLNLSTVNRRRSCSVRDTVPLELNQKGCHLAKIFENYRQK